MITAHALKPRMMLAGFLGAVLSAFLVLCLAGVGRIPREPALGIVAVVCGAITVSIGTWRWARQAR